LFILGVVELQPRRKQIVALACRSDSPLDGNFPASRAILPGA
jgi:hypothetical protein